MTRTCSRRLGRDSDGCGAGAADAHVALHGRHVGGGHLLQRLRPQAANAPVVHFAFLCVCVCAPTATVQAPVLHDACCMACVCVYARARARACVRARVRACARAFVCVPHYEMHVRCTPARSLHCPRRRVRRRRPAGDSRRSASACSDARDADRRAAHCASCIVCVCVIRFVSC